MDWNIEWLFWGGAAYLLAIINLIRTMMGKRKGWSILMFSSLSCGLLTLLSEYRIVAQWIQHGEVPFVMDVVPSLSPTLTTAVFVGILLNFIALIVNTKKK